MLSPDVAMELAKRFVPTLVIFPEDRSKTPYADDRPAPEDTGDYHPCPVDMVLDNFRLYKGGKPFRGPRSIRRGRPGRFATDRDWLADLVANEGALSKAAVNLTGVEADYPSTAWDMYFSILERHGSRDDPNHPYPVVTYARVVSGQEMRESGQDVSGDYADDDVAIQYWWFYYYNHWWNVHEMDWELATVVVRSNGDGDWNAVKAGFAAHLSGHRREWDRVLRNPENGDSPLLFVGAGSHAAYFEPRERGYATVARSVGNLPWLSRIIRWITRRTPLDILSEDMIDIVPPNDAKYFRSTEVRLMPSSAETDDPQWWWMNYPGMWGEKPDRYVDLGDLDLSLISRGPCGPWLQGNRWDNPFAWVDGCRPD